MEAIQCIETRKSIRGFTKEPVPRELLEKVIRTACQSPSYKNSQPWEVIVVSGEKKQELSTLLVDLLDSGEPSTPDLAEPESWPEAEQKRITDLFAKRKELTGIDLTDPAIVIKAKKANFRFYGAPHGIFLFQDNSLSQWSLLDIGLFTQSFMLAAHANGLGTVPQAFLTDYARQIKEYLNIQTGKRLILGLSLGYPDMNSPANSFQTPRSPVNEIVTYVD
ncbi:MAG: hypothetical protein DSY50_01680 [Desulfobulbus sp.]|nr:MAG: hypothetical protein DSY50_01680 [Desulfobulbus sp.]